MRAEDLQGLLLAAFDAWCKANLGPFHHDRDWYWTIFKAGASAAAALQLKKGV